MHTSYYFSPAIIPGTMNLIAISRSVPKHLKGRIRIYQPLCPSWPLVDRYKKGKITEEQYEEEYRAILGKLNPGAVSDDLEPDAVLLCWEQPGKFCHRHIVARWLSSHLGIEIPEL